MRERERGLELVGARGAFAGGWRGGGLASGTSMVADV
jgi:hypothetical protein